MDSFGFDEMEKVFREWDIYNLADFLYDFISDYDPYHFADCADYESVDTIIAALQDDSKRAGIVQYLKDVHDEWSGAQNDTTHYANRTGSLLKTITRLFNS